jgi:predicted RNase H-like HicB family nuclease
VDPLTQYRKKALKLATTKYLGEHDGYVAKIPGFRGLLAVGRTKREALAELESALGDWMDFVIGRGVGLPNLAKHEAKELIPV